MSRIILVSALTALLGATAYPAWAQTAQNPLPFPAGDERFDCDAGPDMAGQGWHGHGQGYGGKHRLNRQRGERGPGHMARMIDANGDNIIGDSEAALLADHSFQRLDRDASGDLDETEFTTVRKRGRWWNWSQAQNEGISEGLKAKFVAIDSDKNRKVSKAEYMADAQTRFTAADTNKDGKVNPWEFYSQN